MKADRLYQMFLQELASEGCDADEWEFLDPGEQIAWGKLCRRLQREHGLESANSNLLRDAGGAAAGAADILRGGPGSKGTE